MLYLFPINILILLNFSTCYLWYLLVGLFLLIKKKQTNTKSVKKVDFVTFFSCYCGGYRSYRLQIFPVRMNLDECTSYNDQHPGLNDKITLKPLFPTLWPMARISEGLCGWDPAKAGSSDGPAFHRRGQQGQSRWPSPPKPEFHTFMQQLFI